MKVRVSTIIEYLLIISCFLLTRIPEYLSIPILSDGWKSRYIIFVIALMICLFYLQNIAGLKNKTKEMCKSLWTYMLFMMIGLIGEYIFVLKRYNIGIINSFVASINFFYVIFFVALIYSFVIHNGIYTIFERLNNLSIFVLLVYCFAFFLYKLVGLNIFKVSVRYGSVRLDAPFFFGILLIYNFWYYIQFGKKKNLWMFVLLALAVYVMSGTRMEMLACTGGLLICFLAKRKSMGKQFLLIVVLFIAAGVLLNLGVFDSIISSFGESSSQYLSTKIRLEAIEYFNNCLEQNPLFGMGFIRGGVNSSWDRILYGPRGKYVFSDLGLYGFIMKTGLCSMLLIGIPLVRLIYLFFISQTKKRTGEHSALLAGLFSYFVICQVSLAFTDIQRGLVLPIIWALFEYCNYQSSERGINNSIVAKVGE